MKKIQPGTIFIISSQKGYSPTVGMFIEENKSEFGWNVCYFFSDTNSLEIKLEPFFWINHLLKNYSTWDIIILEI